MLYNYLRVHEDLWGMGEANAANATPDADSPSVYSQERR